MIILLFVLAALIMVAATLVLLSFKTQTTHTLDRQALLVAVHQQHLSEYTQHTNTIQNQALQDEAKKNLLLDTQEQTSKMSLGRIPWELVLFVIIASIATYSLTGSYSLVTHWQKAIQRLPELSPYLLNSEELEHQDKADLALALRTRLLAENDDYRGWWFLGQLLLDMQKPEQAKQSLEKAYQLNPSASIIWLPYAQALFLMGDYENAQPFIEQVLQQNPEHEQAQMLRGSLLWAQGNHEAATTIWTALYERLDPHSVQAQWLARLLAQNHAPSASSTTLFTVTIDTKTPANMTDNMQLVVFVKDPDLGPMPILAKRITNPVFPVTVQLTPENAVMQESVDWETTKHVQVSARLIPETNNDIRNRAGAWEASVNLKNAAQQTEPIFLFLYPVED